MKFLQMTPNSDQKLASSCRPKSFREKTHLSIVAAVASVLAAHAAHGTTFTYTAPGSGTSTVETPDLWNDGTGWSAIPVSAADTILNFTGTLAADAAVFTRNDIGNGANFLLNQMNFTLDGPSAGGAPNLTISGNPLEFVDDGSTAPILNFSTTNTIKPLVTLQNNLVLTGNLTLSGTTAATLAGSISGGGSLTKTNTSTITLTGANSYAGVTAISAGFLNLRHGSALGGSTAGTTVAAGAQLQLQGGITVTGESVELTSASTAGNPATGGIQFSSVSGNNEWTGPITLAPDVADTANNVRIASLADTLTLSGPISSTGSFRLGDTAIQGTGLVFTGAGNIVSSGVISGAISVISTNSGTVTISEANNTYTGETRLQSGIYVVSSIKNSGVSSSVGAGTQIGFNGGGTLRYVGAGDSTDRRILLLPGIATGTLDASGSGLLTYSGNLANPGVASSDQRKSLVLSGTGLGAFSGNLVNASAGTSTQLALSVTKSGSGTWTLSGNNTYSGGTTLSAGRLNVTNSASIGTGILTFVDGTTIDNTGTNGPVTLTNAGGTIGNFTFAGTESLTLGGNFSFNAAANKTITLEGSGKILTIGGRLAGPNGTSHTLTVNSSNGSRLVLGSLAISSGTNARTLTLNGSANIDILGGVADAAVTTSASNNLIFSGTGILTLAGASTYRGTTTINSGTVNVTGTFDNAVGTAITVRSPATLNLNNTGAVTLKSVTVSGGTLTENATNAISGSAALLVSSGTATLSLSNDYTGGTTLSSTGLLNVGHAGALGATASTLILNGGTLDNTSATDLTLTANNPITIGGNFVFTGTKSLNLGTGAVALGTAQRTITVNDSTLTFGGVISGAGGGLLKTGLGRLVLAGANDYTGLTTVTTGTLQAAAANVFSSASAVVMGTAATAVLDLNGFDQTIASISGGNASGGGVTLGAADLTIANNSSTNIVYTGVISGDGSVIKFGTGIQRLTATNTFAGGLFINQGTLSAGDNVASFGGSGAGAITLGDSTLDADATLRLDSSNPTYLNPLTVADAGAGVLTITQENSVNGKFGGTITLNHDLVILTGATGTGGSLTFSGATTGTAGLTIMNNGSTSSTTFSSTGRLSNNGTITVNNNGATSATTFSGGFSGSGDLTINNNGANSTTTFSGVAVNHTGLITNNGLSAGLTTIGAALGANVQGIVQNSATSKILLTAASPLFTGYVTINAGSVQLGTTSALNFNNVVTIASAGTLDVNGTTSVIAGLSGTGTVSNTNTTAGLKILYLGGSGSNTFSGNFAPPAASDLGLSINLNGAGSQTLSGTGSYSGATTVGAGTLVLTSGNLGAGGTTITVGSGATPVNVAAPTNSARSSGHATLNIAGNYSLGNATSGSLVINGGNTGATPLGQGTLSLLDGTTNSLTLLNATEGNANLVLGGSLGNSSLIDLDLGNLSTDTIAVGSAQTVTLNAGGAAINLYQLTGTTLAAGSYNLITFGGGVTAGSTGAFRLGATPSLPAGKFGSYAVGLNGTGTSVVLDFSGLVDTAPVVYWTGAAGNGLWNSYAQGVSNFSSDAAGTTVAPPPGSNSDVFFTSNSAAVGQNSTTLGQDFVIKSLTFTGTGTTAAATAHTIAGLSTLTIGASGITVDADSANHTISSKVALGANQSWTVNGSAARTLTVSGSVSGGFALEKTGLGTLILSGVNSYGTTTISAGTLQLAGGGTLGAGVITNSATLNFNPTTVAQAVGNKISGSGEITKTSTGTATLSGANDYTGLTTVSNGVLSVSNNSALGSHGNNDPLQGTVVTNSGGGSALARLQLQGGVTIGNEALTLTNNSSNNNAIALQNLSGTNTYSGNITISGSNNIRIDVTSGRLTLAGNVTTTGNLFVLQGGGSSTVGEISGIISGSSALTKSANDEGVWILSGSNTYTGATTISAGTIQLGNGGATGSIANSSSVSIANGKTFAINRNNAVVQTTDFKVIGGAGSFVQMGSGTTTLNALNTYTGATTVSAGTLVAGISSLNGAAGAFGNSAAAITLGNAATTANNSNAALLTGGAFEIGRAVTVSAQATSGTYSIGGGTASASSFSGLVTLNQGVTVSQVAGGTLNLTGGVISGNSGAKTVTFNNAGDVIVSTGAIADGAGGTLALSQTGAGATTLGVANTFTGVTTVTAGQLRAAVEGSLAGTTSLAVTESGSLLFSGSASVPGAGAGRVNDAATVSLGGGSGAATLGYVAGSNGLVEKMSALTLSGDSIIDFGKDSNGTNTNTLIFSDLQGLQLANTLKIFNWTGNIYDLHDANGDDGTLAQDRLLFTMASETDLNTLQGNIRFYRGDTEDSFFAQGALISFTGTDGAFGGATLEIVAIPEPSTVGLLMAAGFAAFCGRRRSRKPLPGRSQA